QNPEPATSPPVATSCARWDGRMISGGSICSTEVSGFQSFKVSQTEGFRESGLPSDPVGEDGARRSLWPVLIVICSCGRKPRLLRFVYIAKRSLFLRPRLNRL